TALVFDRLERKMRMVGELHRATGENWNETFYRLYFRTLGDRANLRAYLRLAGLVPYKTILRERLTPHAVEALLLGASGLLEQCPLDDHTQGLCTTFDHLSAKYSIEAMRPDEWELGGLRPANHPVLRLVQAAAFFAQDQFVMARALACRTEGEICKLFCIEAPDYWQKQCSANEGPRRIGTFKAHIIGINLVAILQFAYGSYTGKETLRDNALTLLEQLPAEENRYIVSWKNRGLDPRNAFGTQALLQLATEYCMPGANDPNRSARTLEAPRCATCPVGKRILRSVRQAQQ
ncbi:MAG: DUF2851 family protein, partial [Alistipes sp.]|nr:DUF2851 family protein [Alistipes sp.]